MASLLAARLVCRAPIVQSAVLRQLPKFPKQSLVRYYASESRDAAARAARRQTIKEKMMAPAGETGKI